MIRGIPSGRWSLPRLVSAACTGLILETSRSAGLHRGASSDTGDFRRPRLLPSTTLLRVGSVLIHNLCCFFVFIFPIFRRPKLTNEYVQNDAASFQLHPRRPEVWRCPPRMWGVIRELCSLQIELSEPQPAIPSIESTQTRVGTTQNGVCDGTSG